jgi:hypothetical protein
MLCDNYSFSSEFRVFFGVEAFSLSNDFGGGLFPCSKGIEDASPDLITTGSE